MATPTIELHDFQKRTIQSLLDGKDVFLSVPTGFGKSVCYQQFPHYYKNTTGDDKCQVIVISPLLAIMREQVDYLNSIGLPSLYISGTEDVQQVQYGLVNFVFSSPEMLLGVEEWRGVMKNSTLVKLVVVDEAHTIIHWGEKQDGKDPFRKWFSMIGEIRSLVFCPALIITATANRSSRTKIKKKLALTSCVEIIQNPDRSNVKLFVSKVKVNQQLEEIFEWIIDLLAEKTKLCPRILIFCASIKMCAELYSAFRMSLDQTNYPHFNMFHSCTSDDMKEKIRQDMEDLNGYIRVLIATSAAGMGVNYQGVHEIVHWGPPKDLDSFVQQLGRAGRDGMQSSEILIYNGRHLCKVDPDMKAYVINEKLCRREVLLEQYESKPNMENLKKHLCCDICANKCECNEESCKTYVHPYFLSKEESDSESSDMDDFLSNSSESDFA